MNQISNEIEFRPSVIFEDIDEIFRKEKCSCILGGCSCIIGVYNRRVREAMPSLGVIGIVQGFEKLKALEGMGFQGPS